MRKIGKFAMVAIIVALGFVFPETHRIPVSECRADGLECSILIRMTF
ncbi:hypothetical protein [Methylomicrobium lacus]